MKLRLISEGEHKDAFGTHKWKTYAQIPTNADRIRSMTDDELAELLEGIRYNWNCPMREKNGSRRCHEYKDDCVQCWLEWLKHEVDA